MQQGVFALITFLHDLFTAVWIGGLFSLALVVLPSLKAVLGLGPDTHKLTEAIQKRLSVLVYISIVGLLVTGLLLSRRAPQFQGLFQFNNTYSLVLGIKHILVLLMIAVALTRSLGFKGKPTPRQAKIKMALLLSNLMLGTGVLLLSGFSAALANTQAPVI